MPWRYWDWTDWLLRLCFGLTLALLVGGVVLLEHDALVAPVQRRTRVPQDRPLRDQHNTDADVH